MPFKFNPFSGNFDQTGSGGGGASYLDGEVEFFSDLPLSAATAPLDSAWLVRKPEGAWFLTKKHAGLYIRTATGGTDRNADYTYAGAGWPDVFSDANFTLYDDADSTKNAKFQLSGISSGTTRTVTMPDANVMLPDQGTSTTNAPSFTGLTVNGTSDTSPVVTIYGAQWFGSVNGNQGVLYQGDIAGKVKVIALNRAFSQYKTLELVSDGNVFSFPSGGGTLARTSDIPAAFDPASPGTIGGTTPAAATFTNLTANTRVNLPNTNGTTAGDLYRTADTLRYRDSTNAERLLLNATDNLANLNSASTARTNLGLGSASDVTFGSLQNTPIGSTTRNSGAFTTLNANTSITGPIGATVGSTSAPAIVFGHSNSGIYVGSNQIIFVKQGVDVLFFDNSSRVNVNTTGGLQIVQTDAPIILTRAISLLPDATNGALAQRSGTQAQEYRVYATHTSSTNYQRMTVKSVKQTLSALSGASATTTGTFIPDGAVVVGVTTRVATALTGATGYTIGDGTDADRWGDITGTAIGTTSDNINWTAGTIECFTAGGNVTLTAKGSNFTAGAIEICVFYLAGEAD